jgi:hypothetical protein
MVNASLRNAPIPTPGKKFAGLQERGGSGAMAVAIADILDDNAAIEPAARSRADQGEMRPWTWG